MAYSDDFLIRAVMTAASGLPQDQIVNDFAFHWEGLLPSQSPDWDNVMGHVGDFYRLGALPSNQVGAFIGDQVSRAATHELQIYEIVVGPMGSPLATLPWLGPVSPPVNKNLPTEVAGVLSFHADLTGIVEEIGATRPKARRRGRIYVGPLTEEAIDGNTAAPTLSTPFRTAMAANAVIMADNAAADDWRWSVWSRADVILRPVVGGWTDNAPDTQRRRGQESTSRATFSI